VAAQWASAVARWRERNAGLRVSLDGMPAPSPADEYMLYQTLVGAWPMELAPGDAEGVQAFAARIAQWQRKALREAKRRSRWTQPNEPYEEACVAFLQALLDPAHGFAGELHAFVQRIAAAGAANSLVQTALRLTTPGVPDTYQGTEFWDLSLVDPDNRRPVDFDAREAALEDAATWEDLLHGWRDGRLKQRLIHELLQLRVRHPSVFAQGGYRALALDTPEGHADGRLLAFQRRLDGHAITVLALRHGANVLLDADTPRWDAEASARSLPPGLRVRGLPPGRYRNVLGEGEAMVAADIDPAAWLDPLPVAVLEPVDAPHAPRP
jgi:(1->4)-alpha-D-glucan 1-alpha-D-glucosylmutase